MYKYNILKTILIFISINSLYIFCYINVIGKFSPHLDISLSQVYNPLMFIFFQGR